MAHAAPIDTICFSAYAMSPAIIVRSRPPESKNMFRRRVVVIKVDNLHKYGFGTRNNASAKTLTLEHNKNGDLNMWNPRSLWVVRIYFIFVIYGSLFHTKTFFYGSIHTIGGTIGLGLGPWLLGKTGGYVRLSQLIRLVLSGLYGLVRWR